MGTSPPPPHANVPSGLAAALRIWSYGIYSLVLAAAGPGLVCTRLRGRVWLQVFWCVLVYGVLLFLGLEARSRCRVPLLPPLYLAAALTLSRAPEQRPDGQEIPIRFWLGAAVSILFLWLAFGGPLLDRA